MTDPRSLRLACLDAPFAVASVALREGFEDIRDGLLKGLETR